MKLIWCLHVMVALTVFFSRANGLRQIGRGALHTLRSPACSSMPRGMVLRSVASSSDQGQKAQMTGDSSSDGGANGKWTVAKVRTQFVDYFKDSHGHKNVISSPVVPVNDPTLLFTNAGMNQFKPIFMGTVEPTSPLAGLRRAVNSQKCIRAGGKHNDLDDVGKDTYHHTFFEMLGTWSFGDYFKEQTIDMAWDLLVNVYGLPPERLYASYFQGDEAAGVPPDEEARRIWSKYLPAERILPFDKADNFWEMGDTGPCGPCTEVHFDRIGGRDAASLVNADDPDVIEIWNLVFIQFNREAGGQLRPLPEQHVDTGMGLERITSILQGKPSNYDTDVFMPLFKAIQAATGAPAYAGLLGAADAEQNYRDTAYRVVADHVRTLAFAIADGATPSNEGRGYVLRRVLRRAVRYGRQTLGATDGFFAKLVPTLVHEYGAAFPELKAKEAHIVEVIREEEAAFSTMLGRGIRWFDDLAVTLQAQAATGETVQISGEQAFYLYDTLGFPADLTAIMAAERGLQVDLDGFARQMQTQKDRSRLAQQAKRLAGRAPLAFGPEETAFLASRGAKPTVNDEHKYQWDAPLHTEVLAVFTAEDGFVPSLPLPLRNPQAAAEAAAAAAAGTEAPLAAFGVVLTESPFYAEGGGQASDLGRLRISQAEAQAGAQAEAEAVTVTVDVLDVQSYGGFLLHTCVHCPADSGTGTGTGTGSGAGAGAVHTGAKATAEVDYVHRRRVAPNHTLTHLLNHALRKVLIGESVEQKGSSVTQDRLRFDFSAKGAVSAAQLRAVEALLNDVIKADVAVSAQLVPLAAAQGINGLRAVFGEAYPDPVRVVSVGAPVAAMLADPTSEAWLAHSVELCGGTHLERTGQAQAVCLVEEAAVAKGIRRIVALTGRPAAAALEAGDALKARLDGMEAAVTASDKQGSAADDASAQAEALEADAAAFRAALDAATMSAGLKGELRAACEALTRRVQAQRNAAFQAAFAQRIRPVLEHVRGLVEANDSAAGAAGEAVVLSLDVGTDGKAVKKAVQEVCKLAPGLSWLGVSSDGQKGGLAVFAVSVPEEGQGVGIDAGAWVQACVGPFGGRGGGKRGSAQGSIGDAEHKEAALEAARAYLKAHT